MMAEPATQTERPFYDAVSDLAKTVEVAVRDIRIHQKPAGFRFSDLKGIGKYNDDFGLVERVAEAYLEQTGADICVFRRPDDFRNTKSAIAENTATAPSMITAWEQYYGKKAVADHWIKNMQANMDEEAGFAIGAIARDGGLAALAETKLRTDIARRVGNGFFSVVNGFYREVYDALNVKENPELLYALAFTAEAEKRGYHQKTGDELAGILNQQRISLREFEYYTGRDLQAEQAEKTRAQQPAPAPVTQIVQARQRPAQTGINADNIGAAVDAAVRGETVRGTIIEPSGVQPVVFENLTIYNLNGQPYRTYRRVVLDGQISNTSKTQAGWIQHYAETPRQLPSFPLLYAMIKDLVRSGNSAKEGMLADLRNYWIATSTQPNYGTGRMIHDAGREPFEFPCRFPEKSAWTKNLDEDGQQTLKALLMPHDLASALQTLQTFSNVPPYLWLPDKKSRQDVPNRAAFAYVYLDRFGLDCGNRPGNGGRSRGVAIE